MTADDILKVLKTMIAEQFGKSEDEIDEDTNYKDDLDADSVDLVELVITLESEYNITAEEDELKNINTVGDTIRMVQSKLDA